MYNLVEQSVNGRPIIKYEVWFMTPTGLYTELFEAVAWCVGADLDPTFNIKAVPVGLTEDSYEVLI